MPQTNPTDAHAINRQILALAVPTFGQLIAEPAFVLIDTAIVGHIGDTALAGLSIGSTFLLTDVGLCVFLAFSTTSQVGHLIGAGRRREGLEAGIDGLWLALIIGSVASLVIFLAAEPLCWAMGARGDVLDNATAYLPLSELVDIAAELERIRKEIEKAQNGLRGVEQKLSNEKFVSRAPEAVVNAEREKAAKYKELIAKLEESAKAMQA